MCMAQALQGLPGLRGGSEGIGLQFGMQELAAAHARAHVAQLQGLHPGLGPLAGNSALANFAALQEDALALLAGPCPC